MRGRVIVDEPEDFQAWVDSQPTFAEIQARAGRATGGSALRPMPSVPPVMVQQGEGNVA